jgi:predicted transcriptional regulator
MQAKINPPTVEAHISLLLKKGFLEVPPHGTWVRYRTTPEGRKMLRKIKEICGNFGCFD